MRTTDLITTAKLRGMLKKLDIPYVDATRANYPSIANGIHIWQLSWSICFKTYNDAEKVYVGKFIEALNEIGLTVRQTLTILGECTGTYDIVPMESVVSE